MKKPVGLILSTVLLLVINKSHAQFAHAANMINFSKSKFTMTNFGYDYIQNADGTYTYNQLVKGDFSQMQVGFAKEVIMPNFFVEAGANLSIKRDVAGYTDMRSATGRGLYFRAAAGPSLGKVFSLWAGAQYEAGGYKLYTSGGALPGDYADIGNTALNPVADRIMVTYHGGNHFGVSGTAAIMLGEVACLRFSYYYNWIRDRGIPGNSSWQSLYYKGNHINPEFSLYLFAGESDFGLRVTYSMNTRTVNCTEGKNGGPTYVPTITSKNNFLMFSFCFPGLLMKK